MKLFITACLLCTLAIGCTNNETKKEETTATTTDSSAAMTTAATDNTAAPALAPLDSATKMKNWMAYATPGDMHKMMAAWNGPWNGEVTFWMTPGAPPMTNKSTATNKMIMEGKYQLSSYKGDMMGAPFEGMGTLAYDNSKKVFVSTWIDNMGTGLMKLEGPWDEATKSMTLTGKAVNGERMDGSEFNFREIFKVVDEKTHMMEMYGPGPDGNEYKMMEIKLTKS